MLRNINQSRLCNNTHLAMKKLMNNIIEARIIKVKYKEDVFISRIPMILTDIPFDIKHLQFLVRLAFEMTINKSPCFSHGQLYIACSRVEKSSALFVYAPDNKTINVVS